MTICTQNKTQFNLLDETGQVLSSLAYTSTTFTDGEIKGGNNYILSGIGTGFWMTYNKSGRSAKINSKIKVEVGGNMTIKMKHDRRTYILKRSAGWKLRFSLAGKNADEILTIIPVVNWDKESYDYIFQINEDFEVECDSFLILQTVHCTNCCLSMMTGGQVPALVSL